MRTLGKIVKPTRTLVEEFQALGYQPDDIRAMAEMSGEPTVGGLIQQGGGQPTSGEVVKNGGGAPAAAPQAHAEPDADEGTDLEHEKPAAEVEIKKEARFKKGKKPLMQNAPAGGPAAPQGGASMPGPAAAPAAPMAPTARMGAESKGKASAPDRLEVILSDLQGLVHESKNFDATKNALIRSYANISKISQAVSEKLDENVNGNKDLFWSLDELAEESLQVAEGLVEGTVSVKAAHEAVNGYVKDLIEHLGPLADELDANIAAALKGLK